MVFVKINKTNYLVNLIHLWIPVLMWALFIFSFSSVTTPQIAEDHWQDFFIKKLAHLIEYGVFSLLLFRALKGSGFNSNKAFLYSLSISIVYGITDEFHQSFTPGREPTVRDATIDGLGSLSVLLAIRYLLPVSPGSFKRFMLKLGVKY